MGPRRPVISTGASATDRGAVARGYLLIAVFYVHALYGVFQSMGANPAQAMAAGAQLKLLAPQISAFFFLSGMAAPHLNRKHWLAAIKPSIVLVILAALSHLGAIAFDLATTPRWYGWRWLAHIALKPIAVGTGYASFVAWFFVVLAAARLFAYLMLRARLVLILVLVVSGALIATADWRGWTDNFYEWRNWPTATLFFLIGMRVAIDRRIPTALGLLALPATLLVAWLNRPGLLAEGPCFTCELAFVAQPMVGQYGSFPVYVAEQLLFITFLLWVSGRTADTMPGRVAAFFGNESLAMLLMHGWVLTLLYFPAGRSLPGKESIFLFVSILATVIVVHGFLFFVFKGALRSVIRFAFRLGGAVTFGIERSLLAFAPRPRGEQK